MLLLLGGVGLYRWTRCWFRCACRPFSSFFPTSSRRPRKLHYLNTSWCVRVQQPYCCFTEYQYRCAWHLVRCWVLSFDNLFLSIRRVFGCVVGATLAAVPAGLFFTLSAPISCNKFVDGCMNMMPLVQYSLCCHDDTVVKSTPSRRNSNASFPDNHESVKPTDTSTAKRLNLRW